MIKSHLCTTLVILTAISVPLVAHAQSTCTVSASGINFGVMSLQNTTNVDSTGTVQVFCSRGTVRYTVLLSSGGGSVPQRRMIANGRFLNYNIFTNPGYTQVWGDGAAGGTTVAGTANQNNPGSHTLYGRVPLASIQGAYSGIYTDSLVVTISY
jgi:spore coat protein U-like protein